MPETSFVCRICSCPGPHTLYRAREMMFGTREEFDYIECSGCGAVQIIAIPSEEAMARHYPADYYSFRPLNTNGFVRWAAAQRDRSLLGLPGIGGAVLATLKPDLVMAGLGEAGVKPSHRILDVGCGRGALLNRLAHAGFAALTGVDPFIEKDMQTSAGVTMLKCHLSEMAPCFDVVMFHHSLEHLADPVTALAKARALLAPDGRCLVRVPTSSSYAWETYRNDWVQLDAPRHFLLPSRQSMALMADAAGFRVERTIDDSDGGQFTGSELYRRDIPLLSPQAKSAFGAKENRDYARRARELNARQHGDQALFILRPR